MKNPYIIQLLQTGKPVELTESTPECIEARAILMGEKQVEDYDFEGAVYWSPDQKVAVVHF